jgi:hypothetical protein
MDRESARVLVLTLRRVDDHPILLSPLERDQQKQKPLQSSDDWAGELLRTSRHAARRETERYQATHAQVYEHEEADEEESEKLLSSREIAAASTLATVDINTFLLFVSRLFST